MNRNRHRVRHLVTPRIFVAMNGYSSGGILYDVSVGGLALDVVGPRLAGERVLLDFDMSETGEHFEGTGRIIWKSESGSRVGIQFIDLPESSHLKIKSWLSAKSISAEALQNVVVQDRLDATFMEYPARLRECVTSPTTSAVLEPPENEQPSVSVYTDSLSPGAQPVPITSEQRSNAIAPPESDDHAATDLRIAFSKLLAAEPKLDETAPATTPQDWKHIRQWMVTAAVVILAVLLLAAGIKISTSPEFNLGATYQTVKSMLVRRVSRVLSSSAPPHVAQPSVSEASQRPNKEPNAPVSKGTTDNAEAGAGTNNNPPANDQFEVMDAQHGRRYFPRTSTSVTVQYERPHKLEPASTLADRNSVPDSVGPVSRSVLNARVSDQIESGSKVGRVSRESSGELPIMETIPEYPVFALQTNVQGRVVLTAIITKDGSLDDVRKLSSPSMLDSTVLDAVRTWRYQPHYENGAPVEVVTEIIVDFSITTK